MPNSHKKCLSAARVKFSLEFANVLVGNGGIRNLIKLSLDAV